jgi:tetratricopeptide (TPR) repeat protein
MLNKIPTDGGEQPYMDPHDEFLELCALSTSGELTAEERDTLAKHLAECAECRKALEQFEAVVDRAVPAFACNLENDEKALPNASLDAAAEARLFESLSREKRIYNGATSRLSDQGAASIQGTSGFRRTIERLEFCLPYAAGIILIVTLGILLLRKGNPRIPEVVHRETRIEQAAEVGQVKGPRDGGAVVAEPSEPHLAERDKVISELRRQIKQQTSELASLRAREQKLQDDVQLSEAEKNRVAAERDDLVQKAATAQASLLRMQKDLDAAVQARTGDTLHSATLEAKLAEVSKLLGDRDKTIGQLQSLLDHDRDIRELMGARDLYIAEVYDVARSGEMQKPCGRVFLTKGKSLIFYAYNLDQAEGIKNGSTFQAWGSLGPDRERALNLGVFYEDNVAKKRWIVRSDDANTLQQIQAVFVTIEPKGGSVKPSGKPFLFAYLRADPNHP